VAEAHAPAVAVCPTEVPVALAAAVPVALAAPVWVNGAPAVPVRESDVAVSAALIVDWKIVAEACDV
jgi:hypothetical protein